MAALRVNEQSSMTLKVQTGTSSTGKAITSNRNIQNISPVATDTALLNFGTALAELQAHTLDSVIRTTTAELIEDE